MTIIKDNNIIITQGDTLTTEVTMGENEVTSDDTIFFYVKKDYNSENYMINPVEILTQTDDEDNIHYILYVSANDMNSLLPREYVYEIKLEGLDVITLVSGTIKVLPKVK